MADQASRTKNFSLVIFANVPSKLTWMLLAPSLSDLLYIILVIYIPFRLIMIIWLDTFADIPIAVHYRVIIRPAKDFFVLHIHSCSAKNFLMFLLNLPNNFVLHHGHEIGLFLGCHLLENFVLSWDPHGGQILLGEFWQLLVLFLKDSHSLSQSSFFEYGFLFHWVKLLV